MKRYALDELPSQWRDFAKHHQYSDSRIADSQYFGVDDQLDVILEFGSHSPPLSEEQLFTLSQNRARKHRVRRRKLLDEYAPQVKLFDEAHPADILIRHEDTARVRADVSPTEWECLWKRALGQSYSEIAESSQLTPAAARSLVSRCRARLRIAATAA